MKQLNMKRLILFFAAITAFGQTIGVTCPNGTQRPSTVVTCQLNWTNNAVTGVTAGIEGVVLVAGLPGTSYTLTVAGTATAAGKTITANSSGKFLITGMNQTIIGAGQIGSITINLPAIPCPPANNYTCITVSVPSALGATAAAVGVTVTPNPPVTVSVSAPISPCDLDGDGLVNAADVDLAKVAVLAGSPFDKNGDGIGNVRDVQIVINAAIGGTCTAI